MSRPQSRGVNEKFDLHGEEAIGAQDSLAFQRKKPKGLGAFCTNVATLCKHSKCLCS